MPNFAYAARYIYTDIVTQNNNLLRVSAYRDAYQTPLASEVATEPRSAPTQFVDGFGNSTHYARMTEPHREFVVLSAGSVSLRKLPYVGDISLDSIELGEDANRFLADSPLVRPSNVVGEAREIAGKRASLLETVSAVVDWVYGNIEYERGWTTVATPAENILVTRRGVCQDMTHLAIALLRALGIPTRYVSGLLITQPGETHAWIEYLHPIHGWLPADPTRGRWLCEDSDIIKFAIGPDYTYAAPVEGTFISSGTGRLDIAMGQALPDDSPPTLRRARDLIQRSIDV